MRQIKNKKAILIIVSAIMVLLLFVGSGVALNGYFGGGQTVAQDQRRGMVGYWKFDDGAGQTTDDLSDQNNDGTRGASSTAASDDPTWTSGKAGLGGALDFDDSNDLVNVPDAASLDFTASADFTIAGWFNRDTATTLDTILAKRVGLIAARVGYAVYIDDVNDKLYLEVSDGTDEYELASTLTFTTTGWNHFVVVWDDDSAANSEIYINGVADNATDTGTIGNIDDLSNASALAIGSLSVIDGAGGNFFDGKVDEPRVYNRALSAAEIRYLYNYGGPVGHWKMDERTGSTAYDATNISNDGTITEATYVAGQYGTALDFDGTNDVVTVTNAAPIDFDVGFKNAVTFSSWINPDNAGEGSGGQFVAKGGGSSTARAWIRVDTLSGGRLDVEASLDLATTDATLNISSAVATGSWSHVVMSYTDDADDEITIYINGINVGSSTNGVGAPPALDIVDLFIGGPFTDNFDGKIDDVRVYTYERSSSEILLDYNQGFAAEFGPSASVNQDVKRGLVGFWKFDDGAGQTTDDSSDLNNDGTRGLTSSEASDDPTWTSGKTGNGGALDFDSTTDLMNVGDDIDFEFPSTTAQFSIAAWVKTDTTPSATNYTIAGKYNSTGLREYYLYINSSNQPLLFLSDDGTGVDATTRTSSSAITVGSWNHVVATIDIGTDNFLIYINGVQVSTTGTGTITDLFAGGASFIVGAVDSESATPDWFMDGIIDEARVYNRALSAAEIRYLYNYGGPVGHWKMDEGTGSTAYDASNISNDGTITEATYVAGQYGTALDFDGTNDVVTVSNANPIDFDVGLKNAVTFSSWINPDNAGEASAGQFIFKGTNTWIRVDTLSGGRLDVEASLDLATTDATVNISSAVATGSWSHVVMSYTDDADDEITIYINGINVGASTNGVGGPATTDTNNLLIAGTTTNNFDGKIDDVRVYTYERSATEILLDYNQGFAAEFGPSASVNQDVKRGLVGFWKFDDGAGGSADDSSDQNNDGTLDGTTGLPTWTSGKAGNGGALDFEEDNSQFVTMGDPASGILDFGDTDDFTIVGWVNRESTGCKGIVTKNSFAACSATLGTGYIVDFDLSNALRLWVRDGTDLYTVTSIQTFTTTGTWIHFAAVWDQDSAENSEIYINGVDDNGTDSGTIGDIGSLANATAFTPGAVAGAGAFFDGLIDEPRVYNRTLSAAEIRYLYNYGGPVGHWKMDEGTGSTAYDASNISNDGTITEATYVAGQYGTALDFDGTNDVVTVSNANPIDFDVGLKNAVTFSSWINPDNAGEASAGQFIFKGTNTWIRVDTLSGGRLDVEASLDLATTDATVNISSAVATGSWSHVVMSYTDDADDEITIYINGINVGASTNGVGGPTTTDTNSLLIAGTTTNNFDGKIDDVRVYTYERSSSEILLDYNVGLSNYFR